MSAIFPQGWKEEDIAVRVEEELNRFDLKADWYPFERSRGERQRIALAGAIAAEPESEHRPRTEPSEFRRLMEETAEKLLRSGVQPVLMTLPPIDAERYLAFICRDGLDRDRILAWLGDVQHIYRFQEAYSDTVAGLAREKNLPLVDVRRRFLMERRMPALIAADGIHLTMPGYIILYDFLTGWFRQEIGASI